MSGNLESFVEDFNSAANKGRFYLLDVLLVSLVYGPVTIASLVSLSILRKRSTPGSRALSLIILSQWIAITFAFILGLIQQCSFYSLTRYAISPEGNLTKQFNSSLQKIILTLEALRFSGNVTYTVWAKKAMDPLYESLGSFANTMEVASSFLAFTMCLAGTMLIGARALQLRAVQQSSQRTRLGTKLRRIMYTLVEWGALLSAAHLYRSIYFMRGTYGRLSKALDISLTTLSNISCVIITAHPTLTALILSRKESYVDNPTFGSQTPVETIRFASIESVTDDQKLGHAEEPER
ncbi:hypothetical protein DL96DRAFT_1719126 [Flagelloscypha sp. PMI_526]|nr:hypothetical protein DL96DRAFT_1719126 [Flagelloscypha sp. PMI_526]